MTTFVEQVKEMGVKQAVIAKADERGRTHHRRYEYQRYSRRPTRR